MYVTLREGSRDPDAPGRRRGGRVAGTVVLLGVVSMLTDVSSEAVAAVLPLYLTAVVGLSPLAYGFIDALYQGVSAVVRIAGGWAADRGDHPKWIAVLGYGLSAVSRLALLPAAGLASITAVVAADRLGKGLRTAPRDSLISASTEPELLGRAFGVHRAMDTAGALVGPLLAFLLLWLLPGSYSSVFVVSFVFAVLGLAVLLLLVPDLRPRRELLLAGSSDQQASPPVAWSWKLLADRRLARLLVVAGALGVLTIGDGFLYLALQRRDNLATEFFPLLFVGTSVAYLALAVPMGRLADRHGRGRVFVLGHLALLGAYVAAAGPFIGAPATIACLLLLGTYYAATDGILAAIAGRLVDPAARTTGIAAAQTVVSMARAVSSLVFGLLWVTVGSGNALWVVAGGLVVVLPLVAGVVTRLDRDDRDAPAAVVTP